MKTNTLKKTVMYAAMLSTMALSCSSTDDNSKIYEPNLKKESKTITIKYTNTNNPNKILAEIIKNTTTNEILTETNLIYSTGIESKVKEKRINNYYNNTYVVEQYNSQGQIMSQQLIDKENNKSALSTYDELGNIERILVDKDNDGKYDIEINKNGIINYEV